MKITERSKQYAQGKALEAITAAIEKAYQDGYNDGLNHLALEEQEAAKTGVTYVDLGLPSGTLWSSVYLYDNPRYHDYKLFTYIDASKLNIPTKEQYEELYKHCQVRESFEQKGSEAQCTGLIFLGVNGNSITTPFCHIMYLKTDLAYQESFYFWIKDDEAGDKKNCAGIITDDQDIMETPISKIFMGLKLPVMLVK